MTEPEYRTLVRIAAALERLCELQAEHVEMGKRMDARQEKQEKELYDDLDEPIPLYPCD